jgi:dolichol-phosphate mannosyltransferase
MSKARTLVPKDGTQRPSSEVTLIPCKDEDQRKNHISMHAVEGGTSVSDREVVIVSPTYNERENILPLICALTNVLQGFEWEVLFVDDSSPDGTAALIREIATSNHRVRLLERIGRRGLSSACIEGMLASSAPFVAVMDADLQHDECILPEMLRQLKSSSSDIIVGSRMIPGGSMGDVSINRVLLSLVASQLTRLACRCRISDPMSGFFVVRRSFLEQFISNVRGSGFKLLFDLLTASADPVKVAEVPYHFRKRKRGESKLNLLVEIEYLRLLAYKLLRRRSLRRAVAA